MEQEEKTKLLRAVRLLESIPEDRLADLGEFLEPVEFPDGEVIFTEGSQGDCMFFVVSGRVRISKLVTEGEMKDLAILGVGDFFGEMELIDDVPRSAQASASGPTQLFRLRRQDMSRWLKSNPDVAVDFFGKMLQTLSCRLRITSNELTLICDLSHMLLEPWDTGKALLSRVLAHVVPHMPGKWSAAAYLYNMFNDEMDFVAGCGGYDFAALHSKLPPHDETRSIWVDDRAYYVSLPGDKRPHGHLILRSESDLDDEQRANTARTLTTVAHLLTSALENINHRTEDGLRERLRQRTSHDALF